MRNKLVAVLAPASLAEAAAAGDWRLCVELIRQGADLEGVDGHGRTPLAHALEQDHLPLVAALIERGAHRGDALRAHLAERANWRFGLTPLTVYNRRRMGKERQAALYRLLELAAAERDRDLTEFVFYYDRMISTEQRLEVLAAMAALGYAPARGMLLQLAAGLRDFTRLTRSGRKSIPARTALAARATELAMTPQRSDALLF